MGGNIIFMPNAQKNYQENQDSKENQNSKNSNPSSSKTEQSLEDYLAGDDFSISKADAPRKIKLILFYPFFLATFFLWWSAGVQVRIMRKRACEKDRIKYFCVGLAILLVSILAFLSMQYTTVTVFKVRTEFAYSISFLYALYLFNTDRMFVATFRKQPKTDGNGNLLPALQRFKAHIVDVGSLIPRLSVTFVICLTMSVVLDTAAFEPELASTMEDTNIASAKRKADKALPAVDELKQDKEGLLTEKEEKKAQIEKFNENLIREINGVVTGEAINSNSSGEKLTGKAGIGYAARQQQERLSRSKEDFKKIEKAVSDVDKKIASFRSTWDEKYNSFLKEEQARNALAARLMALWKLRDSNIAVNYCAILLFLFLMVLDMLPVLIKVFFFPALTDYEKILDWKSKALDSVIARNNNFITRI